MLDKQLERSNFDLPRKRHVYVTLAVLLTAINWFCFSSVCYSQSQGQKSPLDDQTDKETDASMTKYPVIDPETSRPASESKVKSALKWVKRTTSFWKLKYYFVAQNAKDCEFFYGLIQDNPMIGRASVDFNSAGGCNCHGVAQVTHFPHGGGTIGQQGWIKVKCSDGRTMRGTFTTTSLTTGNANFSDNLGHKYESTFGHTAAESIERINALRKELGCPEVTAQEVELKVEGQVIQK
jgi:hypothetical protein